MGKFWKVEKSNHHFPELQPASRWVSRVRHLLSAPRLAAGLSCAAVVVGLVFLLQTNVTAIQGYQIKDLERRVSELREDNKDLRLQAVELQSMSHIIDKTRQSDLVASDHIDIIVPGQSSVARR